MGAERLKVDELGGVEWTHAWRQGAITVRLGQGSGYRWVVDHSRHGAWVYYSERGACDHVDRLLARGAWTAVEPVERITAA
jgi:hypothetical protein